MINYEPNDKVAVSGWARCMAGAAMPPPSSPTPTTPWMVVT